MIPSGESVSKGRVLDQSKDHDLPWMLMYVSVLHGVEFKTLDIGGIRSVLAPLSSSSSSSHHHHVVC